MVDVLDTSDWTQANATLPRAGTLFVAVEDPTHNDSVLCVGGLAPTSVGAEPRNVFQIYATATPPLTTATATPFPTLPTLIPVTTAPATTLDTSTPLTSSAPTTATPTSGVPSPTPSVPTTPPPATGCSPLPPDPSATCIDGTWVIPGLTLSSPQLNVSSPVVIEGALNITQGDAIIRVQPLPNGQVPIRVRDDAALQGTLEIVVNNQTGPDVTVLTAKNITGAFSSVTVIHTDPKASGR